MADTVLVRCAGGHVETGDCTWTELRLRAQLGEGCPMCGSPVEEVPAGDRWSEGKPPDEPPAGPTPPRDIVAMSYGCNCNYEDSTSAGHAPHCRYGEPAAVKAAAWQDTVRQRDALSHLNEAVREQLRVAEATIGRLSAELALAERTIRVSRSHVHAEELDSSMGAATWSALRDAVAAYDQAREATTDG